MDGSALMVPWPIAMLCVAYAALATSSAAALWKAWHEQAVRHSLLWPGVWGVVSTLLVIGLAWLKPWARRLAVWTSVLLMLGSLGVAGMVIVQPRPQPVHSLFATGMAGVQLLLIRYLTRPHVKQWFVSGER